MRLKFVLILALTSSLLIPIASSQAANVLNFSAKELLTLEYSEEVDFVKGDQMSSAELRKEAADFCQELYSSPTLFVKGASGDLGHYKLKYSSSVLSAKWIVAPYGKNKYSLSATCKQWGDFPIPTSGGYKFNFKYNSPHPEKIQTSPWYSKKYMSQNQWKVNYSNTSSIPSAMEYGGKLFLSRWLPLTELPAMPTIRVLSVNDDDPIFRLATLEISGGQFTSTPTGGWDKWTVQFTDSFSLPGIPGQRKYSAEHVGTFTWALKVPKDEVPTPSFEIAVTQSGYRYSSQVGRFVIPSVGESVQLVDVQRTAEGAKIDD